MQHADNENAIPINVMKVNDFVGETVHTQPKAVLTNSIAKTRIAQQHFNG
jgi:hypothetical protein